MDYINLVIHLLILILIVVITGFYYNKGIINKKNVLFILPPLLLLYITKIPFNDIFCSLFGYCPDSSSGSRSRSKKNSCNDEEPTDDKEKSTNVMVHNIDSQSIQFTA